MLIHRETVEQSNYKGLTENLIAINNAFQLIKLYIDSKGEDKNYQEIINFLRKII